MRRPDIITGLDIGSSKAAAVAGQIAKDGMLTILAHATAPSEGVERGLIVSLNECMDSVAGVLMKLGDKIAKRQSDIFVTISGENIRGSMASGMIPLSLRGREVTRHDMDRCVEAASTIHLPHDREIIHKIVQRFSVDDQPWINNPLGLYASRLSCEVYIITADANHSQNIYKCVNGAGYDVKEVVFTGMADAAGILDDNKIEGGVLLLDMGSALTEACIFARGSLSDIDIIAIGGQDIKEDFRNSDKLAGLISRINSKMHSLEEKGSKINSIILTGGMSFTDGMVEHLEEKLQHPIKMGVAKGLKGDISSLDSIRLTTAMGIVKYAYQKRILDQKNIVKTLSGKVVDIINTYF